MICVFTFDKISVFVLLCLHKYSPNKEGHPLSLPADFRANERSMCIIKPGFHGQVFFDKVGLSQKNMLVQSQFFCEVLLPNICDKGERAK